MPPPSQHAPPAPCIGAVLRQARGALAVVGGFSLGLNLLMLTLPIYMIQVFDRVLPTRHGSTLVFLTAIAAGAVVTYGLLEMVRARMLGRVAGWAADRLKGDVLAAALRARSRGMDLGKRPLEELDMLRGLVAGPAVAALFDVPAVPLFIAVIWMLHPALGLLALVAAVGMAALAVVGSRAAQRRAAAARPAEAEAERLAGALVGGAETVLALSMQSGGLERWRGFSDAAAAKRLLAEDLTAAHGALSRAVRLFVQIAVVGFGAWLAIHDALSMGAIPAVSILLGRALAPVDVLVGSWRQISHARTAIAMLDEVLRQTPPPDAPLGFPEGGATLACRGLTVQAPSGGGKVLLRNVSFHLEPAETLAVVGPSGAGKTTLCRALLGVLPPLGGSVRFGGADLTQWRTGASAQAVGSLPQRLEFLPGSVRDNIARFRDDADDAAIVRAAQRAGAHETILALPQGYHTPLAADGAPLSAGHAQLLGLARALFGEPCLLVLDEPNMALDSDGAGALMNALAEAKCWGATIILTTHTPALVSRSDKVLSLRAGQAVSFGLPPQAVPVRAGGLAG
ncbi:MAG: type I secretion system permease/ATPase [Rhodospirillaceae bacterium]